MLAFAPEIRLLSAVTERLRDPVVMTSVSNKRGSQMAITKILVPLDGSMNSAKIGGWAVGLARSLAAEVTLVTVVDIDKIKLPNSTAEHGHPIPGQPSRYDHPGGGTTRPYAGATGMVGGATMTPGNGGAVRRSPSFGTQIIDQAMSEASTYLEYHVERMNSANVKTTSKVLTGGAAEAIVRYATEIGADMVAMATRRGSAISRGVLGSVTDKVMQTAGIPVMAIHPEALNAFDGTKGQPETIVVPLDGSERSASIVELALETAKSAGAEILFTRATNVRRFGMGPTDASYLNTTAGSSVHRHESEEYLMSFVEKAEIRGVRSRYVVLTGDPAASLIEEVRSLSNPLIMMSTRGNSGIKRWAFGSVADEVLRSSGLPIIIVQPVPKMMELLANAKGISYTHQLQNGRHSRFEAVVSTGECPLGVTAGYAWNVKQSGKMDAPICMAAASALDECGSDPTACICPYGENKVVFGASSI